MPPLTQQQIYELYRSIGTVYSPALREDVRFEGDGLKHIFFKSRKSKRLAADWKRRGGLLDGAVRIVSKIDKVSEALENWLQP